MITKADVLETAADILDVPGGWCQGTLFTYADPIRSPWQSQVVSACLVGGIKLALMKLTGREDDKFFHGAVYKAVIDQLGTDHVAGWNDHYDRTQGEVVDLLRRTAKDLRNDQ